MSVYDDLTAAWNESTDSTGADDASLRHLALDMARLATRQADRGQQAQALNSLQVSRDRVNAIADDALRGSTLGLHQQAVDYVGALGRQDQGALKVAAAGADQAFIAKAQVVPDDVQIANALELQAYEAARRGENPDLAYLKGAAVNAAGDFAAAASSAWSSARTPLIVAAAAVALAATGWIVYQVASVWKLGKKASS